MKKSTYGLFFLWRSRLATFSQRVSLYFCNTAEMSEDLDALMDQAASEPQSATVDGQSVAARPITELIELDKYRRKLAAAAARKSRGFGVSKIIPPGMAD